MIDTYTEDNIFQAALDAFRKNIGLHVDFLINAVRDPNLRVDRILQMTIQGREICFCVEIKTNINRAIIGQLLILKNTLPHPLLLTTNHVTGYMADQLRQNEIEFIDVAGNAYINHPPIYIYIKGNRPPVDFIHIPHRQAFRPTGLKVVFVLLCNPDLINRPYREIADTAGVALGNIGLIIRDLKKLGFLLDMGKIGYKLVQKEQLLNRWVTEYPEKLRPKLLLGRFRGVQDWWQQKNLNCNYARWGGEVAADKLTKYLKPENIIIYAKKMHLKNLLIENKLKRDINGEIEILNHFWKPVGENELQDVVHPILIYADLMATGNQRNIETAKVIFEQYIIQHIR